MLTNAKLEELDIPSRFTERFGPLLYALAIAKQPQLIVETGTCHGHLTAHLGLAAATYGGRVVSIDYYEEQPPHATTGDLERVSERLKQLGVDECVELVQGDSLITLRSLRQSGRLSEAGLVMIDDNHGYDWVREELNVVIPALQPGALVVMHDTFGVGLEGVRRAMLEARSTYGLDAIELPDSNGLTILQT